MRKCTSCIAAVAIGVLGTITNSATPALAARACTPGVQYGFAGASSSFTSSIFGARASIEYNNPDLCGSDANDHGFSTIWSMVTALPVDSAGKQSYAQAGYYQAGAAAGGYNTGIWRWGRYTPKCFAHGNCAPGDVGFRNLYSGHPDGTKEFYSVYRLASTGHVVMYAGSDYLGETTYDPTGDWQPAWQAQLFGETHDHGDDVPGTDSDRTTMDYLQYYNSSGGINFLSSVTGATTSGTRYHRDVYNSSVGGKGVNVWTDPQ